MILQPQNRQNVEKLTEIVRLLVALVVAVVKIVKTLRPVADQMQIARLLQHHCHHCPVAIPRLGVYEEVGDGLTVDDIDQDLMVQNTQHIPMGMPRKRGQTKRARRKAPRLTALRQPHAPRILAHADLPRLGGKDHGILGGQNGLFPDLPAV